MKKNLGQVFTPTWIVNLMIQDKDLLNENILEPSCGDGAFLMVIVKNILELNISLKTKRNFLENNITAFEIDESIYNQCINNLNKLCADYGLKDIKWNIFNEDTLKHDFGNAKYTYIVGNPPYVRLHNMDNDYRIFIKNNFSLCKGTTDLYLAFYEKCIKLLNDNGELCFITPNSFLRNVGFKDFRKYIKDNKLLNKIIDFKSSKIFNAATYCAIMNLSKNNETFTYEEYEMNKKKIERSYNVNTLSEKAWIFTEIRDINRNVLDFNINVQYGLATLRDKIFISSDYEDIDDELCKFNGILIEKNILKPIIKGSRLNKRETYCIFPYKLESDKLRPLTENEMKDEFPKCYEYLLSNKEELLKRDLDKNYISWFQYGRSQGLKNILKQKLVIDPILDPGKKLRCEIFNENTLVYSGIFITGERLEELRNILTTSDFSRFIGIYGKDMQGGFKSISTKLIMQYIKKDYAG